MISLLQTRHCDSPNENLQRILETHFHLKSFRKGQKEILTSVVNRKDALAVLPTGGGKSLCYQLPSLFFDGLVIVTSPLIALMKDQVRLLKKNGLAAGCLHSGQTNDEKREVFQAIQRGGPYVLFLSPERVQNSGFKEWILKQKVVLFAIDEAHCVSQWGPDFREDYHKLHIFRDLRPDIPILALTATATPEVLSDIGQQLKLQKPDRHVYGFYRPNLFYQVEICLDEEYKFGFLVNALRKTPEGRILIYCGTRQQSETVAAHLSRTFEHVGYYHAGMSNEERRNIQEQLDQRKLRILVATNAFGMGIDYPDVRLVIHFQMPANIESFYQEMGRAGRDGEPSLCLLLYSKKDKGLQSYFITQSKAASHIIRRRWNSLDALTQFIEGGECRHAGILTYFKDSERIRSCGHCDICSPGSPMVVAPPELNISLRLSPAPKVKKKIAKEKPQEITSPEAEARRILLKDWRRLYAQELDLPAFIIFSDRTLVDLANKNPETLTELAHIYGLGPAKIEQFGHLLLRELGHS